jgi:RND family efflux transporter MFP subunit
VQSLAAADGTALAKIKAIYLAYENTRFALEYTQLIAPFDGSVVALNVTKGQSVTTSPMMTLATTNRLMVRFYLDETDVSKAAAGNPVVFTLDAYPDATVTGKILLMEPALQIVDGTPVVVVWASLPEDAPFTILSGMTVEAEVIAAEAHDTLLVPVQALRELTPGSFAVFVVQSDGSLKMAPVTVGLRDFANAEILSGLKVGDVVSTGTVETK